MTDVGVSNGFGAGTPTTGAPVNAGTPTAEPTPQTQTQTTPAVTGTGESTQQVTTPTGDNFDHRIRSALTSAEQTWAQKNQTAIELEKAFREMGRDPGQVLQQVRDMQRQAQIEAQQAQAQGMGINPQLMQYMQNLEQQVKTITNTEGQRRLAEAEQNLTGFAKQYGINYDDSMVRMEVRQFAHDNNVNLDTAFKSLYFDRILQVNGQQAQGQAIAAIQGRGPQPISSAVPGSSTTGTPDISKMSSKDFHEYKMGMRQGR